jgi:nucleoid-associated protein YejK
MSDAFEIEHVALHLINREQRGPRFSNKEIDLSVFTKKEDIEAINNFFSGHLKKIWDAPEGRRTRAATFTELSMMNQYFKDMVETPAQFFEVSRHMAQRLYDVSKSVPSSPGLLMIILFKIRGSKTHYLALFKMDPGKTEKVVLRQDQAGQTLLDLAVRHIERVLPDPDDRILKWAVMPHPTRLAFDAKVKDQEARIEPAQYFMTFLGCEARPNEKNQIAGLLSILTTYTQKNHPDEDWGATNQEIMRELESEPVITPKVMVDKIEEMEILPGFQGDKFIQHVKEADAEDLYVSSNTLRSIKIEYKLPSDIIIRGPRAVMESIVDIIKVNREYEFRIRTPDYDKKYV